MVRKTLFIGAIILTGMMAFHIYIPIIFILLSASLALSICYLYKIKALFIGIILLSTVIGSLANLRINSEISYFPFNKEEVLSLDLIILSDSKRIGDRYISEAEVTRWYGIGIVSRSKERVALYSDIELFKGDAIYQLVYRKNLTFIRGKGEYKDLNTSREKVLSKLSDRVDSDLLYAMLTGNKNRIDHQILNSFRESGLSHILALSGFHLGVIVLLIYLTMANFCSIRLISITTSIFLIFYIYLIGPSPSIIRSFLMYIIGVIYKEYSGRIDIKSSYLISYYISILLFPGDFTSLSFLLSFLSLFGIIYFTPMLIDLPPFRKLPVILGSSFGASISAILATGLLLIYTFGEIYPVGLVASTIISPIIVVYMFIGIASIVITPLKEIIKILDIILFRLCDYFSNFYSISIKDNNIYPVTFIFISLPVILYLVTVLRSRDIGRFNTEFKL